MHSMPYGRAQVTFQPEDDVDELFNRLSQIEPPGELVSRILTHIEYLPGPLAPTSLAQQNLTSGEAHKRLIVRNEWREPS